MSRNSIPHTTKFLRMDVSDPRHVAHARTRSPEPARDLNTYRPESFRKLRAPSQNISAISEIGSLKRSIAACDETAVAKFPNLEQLVAVVQSCQVRAFHRARTACTHRYEVGLGFIKLHQCRSSVDTCRVLSRLRSLRRVGPTLLTLYSLSLPIPCYRYFL